MTEQSFVPTPYKNILPKGKVTWESPSNIALVKYWGKLPNQIPANPSVSFTLNTAVTTTTLHYEKRTIASADYSFDLFFEGKPKPDFKPKIETFFNRISSYLPFLMDYHFEIQSSNSFPHSSGIASSASSMAALALCLLEMEKSLDPAMSEDHFYKKASFLARLGSGSACRSITGSIVQWGKHNEIEESSDLFGISYTAEVHPVFQNYKDTILLVHKGQKQVSSTAGHNLMHAHPFAAERFEQAHRNISKMMAILKEGDLIKFMELVESEALTLHAMMMTSLPYFILMKPKTLEIIEKIWAFRVATNVPVCFTLDAGANVHVLYPEKASEKVLQFIKNELVAYCENGQYICDQIGNGSKKIGSISDL
ncbi:MAG: diphosphomevalonate decarboxylase [Arenibacter sp.]|nr:diphosphomevalonate decarboxylase [Arenibacter sp.]